MWRLWQLYSVEATVSVIVSTLPKEEETAGGVLGLPGYVLISISNLGMTTEEVLVKQEFSAPSEGTALFSFWNFPERTQVAQGHGELGFDISTTSVGNLCSISLTIK